ncbi:MAG: 3-oxoadipate enol-lactonase [Rhodospirillales bacterium]
MKADVNGISIHYSIEGKEGAPWLTFSNSLATNMSMWDDQVAHLKNDFHILRYDTRGHGQSEAVAGSYTFGMLVGDVIGLWDALGIEQSHFVGLSLGGMTALGLAIDRADRVTSITVCDARGQTTPEYSRMWDGRIAAVQKGGMAGIVEGTLERWFTKDFLASNPPVLEKVKEMIRTTAPEGFVGCARALQTLNYTPRIGRIGKPALFVVGSQDVAAPPAEMKALAAAVKGAGYIELDPAAHISNIERTDEFNTAVTNFLEKHT